MSPHPIDEPVVDRPTVTPVECEPWCRDGDGHPKEAGLEDQVCWSPSVAVCPATPILDGSYERIEVFARKDPGRRTSIVLWAMQHDAEISLTVHEARQFVECFTDILRLVEGGLRTVETPSGRAGGES
jgi:hypothetical protein